LKGWVVTYRSNEKPAMTPSLTAEDLANAWNYARSHREKMDREIATNGDDSSQ